MKKYFPVFIDLEGKDILVVGGGKIASRKIHTLLEYNASIEIISIEIKDKKLKKLVEDKKIKSISRKFKDSDMENRFMVIAATEDKKLNELIYELGDSKNILVNNITTKDKLNTKFSAIYKGNDFQIAISTDLGDPKRALEIKNKLSEVILSKKY